MFPNVNPRLSLFGAALLFPLHLLASDPPSVLWSRFDFDSRPYPVFIAATAVLNADGSPSAIVPQDWRIGPQHFRSLAPRPNSQTLRLDSPLGVWDSTTLCQHGTLEVDDDPEERAIRDNAHNAIANARAIVSGTIKRVIPGFFNGFPASLVELDHIDRIKLGTSYSAAHEVLYLRLPYARFAIGDIEYCRSSGPGSYVPRIGDELLVFAYVPPPDVDGTLLYLSDDDIIAQSSLKRDLRIPKSLAFFGSTGSTIGSITASIRAVLSPSGPLKVR
jgi:hypothetical protein